MEMSMKSRKELTQITARRYRGSNRAAKGRILGEFCKSTGYNRAYSAMLLRTYGRSSLMGHEGTAVRLVTTKGHRGHGGRPPRYEAQVSQVVHSLWKRLGYPCGKRLAPIIRRWISCIRADRFLHPSAKVCRALMSISPATIDRLLKPTRQKLRVRGLSHTHSNPTLQQLIPVRTFGDFSQVPPGHCQLDTVAHDGGIASGEYAFSVVFSDVCTAWTERRAVQNRASRWIQQALDEMLQSVPFAVRHLHPDSGSEFVNHNILRYCSQHGIRLTRSRPGKKNDNCWVEQKNFDTVRKLVGYSRYSSPQALQSLNELYRLQGLLQNYVLPSQKLLDKTRIGSRYRKRYDTFLTPAERVLLHPQASARAKKHIRQVRAGLNPLALAGQIITLQKQLFSQAEKLSSVQLREVAAL